MYLDSRDKHRKYSSLEKSEFAFKEAQKYLQKIKIEGDREIFLNSVWSLVDLSIDGDLSGRIYSQIKVLYEDLPKLKTNIAKEFKIEVEKKDESNSKNIKLNLLKKQKDIPTFDINKVLKTPDDNKKLADVCRDIIESRQELEKIKDMKELTLNMLQKANSLIEDGIGGLSAGPEKKPIENQLKSLEANLEKIRNWLEK